MAPALNRNDLTWRSVPTGTYGTLQRALVQHGAAQGGYVICDRDLPQSLVAEWVEGMPFTVLVTPQEQALAVQTEVPVTGADSQVTLGMTCEGAVIATFLQALSDHLPAIFPLRSPLAAAIHDLTHGSEPRNSTGLLLSLVPLLQGTATSLELNSHPAAASQHQQAQDLLLNQVITKIRDSLDLDQVLATTAAEVRQLLGADRLMIYQCKVPPHPEAALEPRVTPPPEQPLSAVSGVIRYEACGSSAALLTGQDKDQDWDIAMSAHWQTHLVGQPTVIPDVEQAYSERRDLLAILTRGHIQAQILAPILIRGRLWGVLWVQQCHQPRPWQPQEQQFVQHIAEHLGIAIQQAELYHQISEQAESLEACVTAQTQGLRDAMLAAQAANRTKSEFLATMSHELRTPLTCIIGLSATLLRWSFGDLSQRQREYLTTIHSSGERLLSLINDILELSKIESGRTVLSVAPLSLSQLVHQCWDAFRPEARDRAIELTYDTLAITDHDTFVGDAQRIQQIIGNLLSNALKFTEAEGQVNLRVRWEQQTVVFQVEDTGIGIPADQQLRLFEIFYQLETGHRRQYQGTGLGLALTKQLVELHGGTITVHSHVGVGSVFTVRLPEQRLERYHRPTLAPDEPTPEPVAGRVVLVEDCEETARVICDLLTAADYQVIWVIDGSQVLEQVALLQPAVIIVNLQLVNIDGHHIMRDLRHSLVTDHIRILGLAADGQVPSHDPGFDAILDKPLVAEQLLEKVNALMAIAPVQTPSS
jgi:two-component system sensor histidine kinase/response regulator